MIHTKDLSVKNFMSVGNAMQVINLYHHDITLVLGENPNLAPGDVKFESVNQIIDIEPVFYDPKLLLQIYQVL